MKNNFISQDFSSDILGESYVRYTHVSGLNVYVFHKKAAATYALFGTACGSINDSIRAGNVTAAIPDGVAHFLEHKLFFNEDGSDSFERFSEYGADANAYTAFNKTAYLFSCTDELERTLVELIDFVTHPYFTEESVAAELGIITEEIKMYDDNPFDRCFYGMLEGMYESHPIRKNICGTERSIRQITAKTLYDCYRAFYNPRTMALVICGDVDDGLVLDVVDRRLPKDFTDSEEYGTVVSFSECRTAYKPYVEQSMAVSKPIFNIGYKDVAIPEDTRELQRRDAVMSILDEMLFSRAGELYNDLFERKLISPALSYGYTVSSTFAYHSLAGESDSPATVLDEIRAYIASTRIRGLDREEFLRAKRVMFAEWIKSFDTTENIANSLFSFVTEGAEMLEYTELLEGVTFEDVQVAFDQSFAEDTLTLSVVKPINSD